MSGRYGWCNLQSTFPKAVCPSFTWSPMQRQGEASTPVLEVAAPRTGGPTCQACSAVSCGQDAPPALCAGDPPPHCLCTWYHPSRTPPTLLPAPGPLAPPASGNPWFSVFSEGLPILIHLLSNLDSFTITYATILPYGQDTFYSAVFKFYQGKSHNFYSYLYISSNVEASWQYWKKPHEGHGKNTLCIPTAIYLLLSWFVSLIINYLNLSELVFTDAKSIN